MLPGEHVWGEALLSDSLQSVRSGEGGGTQPPLYMGRGWRHPSGVVRGCILSQRAAEATAAETCIWNPPLVICIVDPNLTESPGKDTATRTQSRTGESGEGRGRESVSGDAGEVCFHLQTRVSCSLSVEGGRGGWEDGAGQFLRFCHEHPQRDHLKGGVAPASSTFGTERGGREG